MEGKITLDELDNLTKGCETIPQPELNVPTKLEEVKMEPENKFGVDAIVKLIGLVKSAKDAYKKVMEDKKVDYKDSLTAAGFIGEVILAIPSLVALPDELKDFFTEEEIKQLVDACIEAELIKPEDEEKADKVAKIISDIKNFIFTYIVK